jgi:gamma-glutamylcyclotransferase (GGCT)/AIG2-like uncharacterized protein YtfP
MSKWKPDLGELLYKRPQLKNRLLNQTFILTNSSFILRKEQEGFEVTSIMPFPGVSQREEEVYCFTLRFPFETNLDKLQRALDDNYVSFQIVGLCRGYKSPLGEKYRPLNVIWIDIDNNTEEFVPR